MPSLKGATPKNAAAQPSHTRRAGGPNASLRRGDDDDKVIIHVRFGNSMDLKEFERTSRTGGARVRRRCCSQGTYMQRRTSWQRTLNVCAASHPHNQCLPSVDFNVIFIEGKKREIVSAFSDSKKKDHRKIIFLFCAHQSTDFAIQCRRFVLMI